MRNFPHGGKLAHSDKDAGCECWEEYRGERRQTGKEIFNRAAARLKGLYVVQTQYFMIFTILMR